jgi:uncharacterized NAD(P)/FAD-binding protein YdhS
MSKYKPQRPVSHHGASPVPIVLQRGKARSHQFCIIFHHSHHKTPAAKQRRRQRSGHPHSHHTSTPVDTTFLVSINRQNSQKLHQRGQAISSQHVFRRFHSRHHNSSIIPKTRQQAATINHMTLTGKEANNIREDKSAVITFAADST